ncbi:helix-turn-helix domain-containing protein [Paenibacillus sp. BK720]|uniref:response regulator transcription factor n=1 Tax=Paenibacillus sp. BK720 TaxID=2587092 RepID=UPI0014211636|nr:helix-turn-helix domain-containing protein [Paenibacillus sp. BK720]NIK70359.1 two-component system response regulator YesN [Paenibacillus sp. BK720]
MARMLVVDDEKFAVDGICECNDWSTLGIEAVFTANHADAARTILKEHRIDILVCDIEMPDEDGLSLVRWVKEHSPHTESLFLTCHSEFAYAKQAVNLGSFDYLLKPVDGEELVQAVSLMLQAVREKEESIQHHAGYRKYAELWRKQQPLLAERFWQDLLSRRQLSFGDFLERGLRDAQIELEAEGRVMPILISIEEWHKSLDARDQEIMEYAVKKAAGELFLSGCAGDVITDRGGVMFAMVYTAGAARSAGSWVETGRRFIEVCRTYFYCQITCYIGKFVSLQEVSGLCEGLKDRERHNVKESQSVIVYVPQGGAAAPLLVPDSINVTEWTSYMLNRERDKVISLINRSVDKLEARQIHQNQLETYHLDTLQVVYGFMHVKGIGPSQVPNFPLWASAQIRSLTQYRHWAANIVSAVMDAAFTALESDSVVQKSIQYMKENVEEDISREDVAAHVGLNPAYLSRLFKKETGQNLIDYLIETKMVRAKYLLDATGMTVSAIAQQVGYSNFSHFTKMFKKQYGVNPQEYRNVTKRLD